MMRVPPFRYRLPRSVADAAAWLAEDPQNSMVLAGGTDLLPKMKRRQQTPGTLVSLRHLSGLSTLADDGNGVTIGAAVTLSQLAADMRVRGEYAGVAQAAAQVATPHLRNAGTIGGNLCVDTRCTYYDQTYDWRKAIGFCLKREGSTCWVAPSSDRCLAVSSTDTAPVLQALSASLTLVSAGGTRIVPLADFYANDGVHYLTKRPDEILTSIALPRAAGWRSAYWKLRRRGSFDFPVAAAAVAAQLDGRQVIDVRIVLGAVASKPLPCPKAESLLKGQLLTDDAIDAAAAAAAEIAKPMDNTDFELVWRKKMVTTLVREALREVGGDDVRAARARLTRLEMLS